MTTHNPPTETIDGRISKLETLVEGLADTVDKLSRVVSGLSDRVGTQGRPSMMTLFAAAGTFLAVWTFLIQPIWDSINDARDRQLEHARSIGELQITATKNTMELKLIETQLNAAGKLQSQADQYQYALLSILWRDTRGHSTPDIDYWPHMGVEASAGN